MIDPAYDFSSDSDNAFIIWMYANDREYTSLSEYLTRLAEFVKDQEDVAEFNANSDTSFIGTNKFSDSSPEELLTLLSSGLD